MTTLAERPVVTSVAPAPSGGIRDRMRGWPLSAWLGPLAAIGLSVWITASAWGPRPLAGEDVMFHLVRADVGVDELFAHGHLDGWSPRFYLGHQLFLVYGPGSTWMIGLARLLTGGALSNVGAHKLVALASYAALPVAVAFLARSYGLTRRASGFAALLSLLVSNIYGLGLEGLLVVGLFSHQVGAVGFCVALGALLRVPVDPRARWVVLGAVALACLGVTHLISVGVLAIVYAVSLACLLLTDRWSVASWRRLAITVAGAVGLAGFWIVPVLAHRDLIGQAATWATPPFGERVGDILDGDVLFQPYVAAIVLAAWVYGLARAARRRRYALAFMAAPVVFLVVAHAAAHHWRTNISAVQLANRGLGYMGLLAVLPLAAFAGMVAFRARRSSAGVGGELLVVGVVTVLVALSFGELRDLPGEFGTPIPQMERAATELGRLVPDGARFATQRDYPAEIDRTGVIHPETWLARAAGRNSLNGVGLESTTVRDAPFEPEELATRPPEQSADALSELGVTHVVTTAVGLAEYFETSARMRLEWQDAPLAIFAIVPRAGQPSPASLLATETPASARLMEARREYLRIDVDATTATDATVALGWSPKWHARVDGEEVETHETEDGRIGIALPAGRSRLELRFDRDRWDRVGLATSVFTVAALAAWCVARRRRASLSGR